MFGWHRGMRGGFGPGFGFWQNFPAPWWNAWGFPGMSELEWLKRYKEHLEMIKKDLQAELEAVDERIRNLEKSEHQEARKEESQ